ISEVWLKTDDGKAVNFVQKYLEKLGATFIIWYYFGSTQKELKEWNLFNFEDEEFKIIKVNPTIRDVVLHFLTTKRLTVFKSGFQPSAEDEKNIGKIHFDFKPFSQLPEQIFNSEFHENSDVSGIVVHEQFEIWVQTNDWQKVIFLEELANNENNYGKLESSTFENDDKIVEFLGEFMMDSVSNNKIINGIVISANKVISFWLKPANVQFLKEIAQTLEKLSNSKEFKYSTHGQKFAVKFLNSDNEMIYGDDLTIETMFDLAGTVILYKRESETVKPDSHFAVAIFHCEPDQWKNEICNLFKDLRNESIPEFENMINEISCNWDRYSQKATIKLFLSLDEYVQTKEPLILLAGAVKRLLLKSLQPNLVRIQVPVYVLKNGEPLFFL
uniref:Uncharacterized protein n=1 Tax=Panagrolaimus sp. JU765 TaxID=591449 RepID=A0AC34PZR3_9BILA